MSSTVEPVCDKRSPKCGQLRLTPELVDSKKTPVPLSPGSRGSQSPVSPGHYFQLPSPIITRRARTYSASERAAKNPVITGKVKYFCRHKGHGYVTPDDGGEDMFLHVSDVDGEFVPCEGDEVSFRACPVPPKNERSQAVHAVILNMAPGTHEKWDVPSSPGVFGSQLLDGAGSLPFD